MLHYFYINTRRSIYLFRESIYTFLVVVFFLEQSAFLSMHVQKVSLQYLVPGACLPFDQWSGMIDRNVTCFSSQ